MATALLTQSDLVAMLPSLAILITFLAVGGGCIYLSYRVGQVISPTSRKLQQRFGELEAAVARSAGHVRESLERHRDESAKEAERRLDASAQVSEAQATFVRRGLEDFGDRLNGVRLDLVRDSTHFREEVQGTFVSLRESARDASAELARMQSEMLASMTAQLRELAGDSERGHERAKASLEAIGADLQATYALSAREVRERSAAQLVEVREALTQFGGTIASQGTQLDGVDRAFKAALQEGAAKHDALNAGVEAQFKAFHSYFAEQFVSMLAADARLESSWTPLKKDFEAITRSIVQMSRAVDVLKNELTVKLEDAGGKTEIDGLLERILQPDEFQRDVELEPGSNRRVAFAVRLSDNPLTRVWLPISVLPVVQGYNEFVAATVYNNAEGIASSSEAFERAILAAAEELSSRFICPPRTLNLAVLLAPIDDVFEEIVRRDSLVDAVRNFHVVIAGPSTLPTLLTGLRMAFMGTRAAPVNLSNGPLDSTLAAKAD
jgi:DNA recombination protein RmuC